MSRVWPGVVVEENTLQFHISALRKALGPDRDFTKTISGRGYRFIPSAACSRPFGSGQRCGALRKRTESRTACGMGWQSRALQRRFERGCCTRQLDPKGTV